MRQRRQQPGDRRPSREEVDPAALELIAKHGRQVLATARRYSSNLEDAEDAYQRGLEILLTKAPTTHEEELVPWLKTVVKHEAFAIRQARERAAPTTDDGEPVERPAGAAADDQAERFERLQLGAEALRRLKPQEVRCLLLKAEGYSYREICRITGFTYTKVNRCLTEGRRAFVERVSGIEGGGECERLAPLVSRLADGEASSADLRALRPHLKTCLACRARLREYRAAPARVAALLPPVAVAASGGDPAGPLRGFVESLIGSAQERAVTMGDRLHAASEVAAGKKAAAVAASAAALAGGGATVDRLGAPERKAQADRTPTAEPSRPVKQEKPVPAVPAHATRPDPAASRPAPAPPPVAPSAAAPPPPPPPDPANEFAPGGAAQPSGGASSAPGGGGGSSGTAAGGGEFGP